MQKQQQRVWLLIAIVAIVTALVLMLIPHGYSGNPIVWLAILPVLFVGVIALLRLLPCSVYADHGYVPDSPALPTLFQRPPPLLIA